MQRILFSISLFVFIFSAATLPVLFFQRNSRPAIICASLDDSIRPRDYCLMNPFRDKQPEIEAERILQELKNGHTDVLVPFLTEFVPDIQNHYLENERRYRIENWRLGALDRRENKLLLMYWVSRQNYADGHLESISFLLERDEEDWKLKAFTAGY